MEETKSKIMEKQNKQPTTDMRSYILVQGRSIIRLLDLLNSSLLLHHTRKWISVLLEIGLYLLFLLTLVGSTATSTVFSVSIAKGMKANVEDILPVLIVFSVCLLLLAFPALFLALLLRRNRKKSTRIREAFAEVQEMKRKFEEATDVFKSN
jgi:hypothetical protein